MRHGMNRKTRRQALQMAMGTLAVGLMVSPGARAAWPKDAFEAKTVKEALEALFKASSPTKSDAVTLLAPELAENGTVVPVTVQTSLPNVESVAFLADGNPRALVAMMTLSPRSQPPLTVRMKLAQSQNVVVVVKAGGSFHTASRMVKVSIGGCGG